MIPTIVDAVTVAYTVTAGGRKRTFRTVASVSGSPAESALKLIPAPLGDIAAWLRNDDASRLVPTTFGMPTSKGLGRLLHPIFGVTSYRPAPPDITIPTYVVTVVATATIDGEEHRYSGEARTDGAAGRTAYALACAAKSDLWNWAWAAKSGRAA